MHPGISSRNDSIPGVTGVYLGLFIAVLLACLCAPLAAQENYLVSTADGTLSLYDLTTNTSITSVKGTGLSDVLPGPNTRLAFALNSDYLSVIDTTVQREVRRLTAVNGLSAALTPDGKLLLVAGLDGFLRVVDTAQLTVVHTVSLLPILGANPTGSVVIAANKAYVFPFASALSNVAVVDLTSYSVSSVALPAGYFLGQSLAAATPDGNTIVTTEVENKDALLHVVVISTATNGIVGDFLQSSSITWSYALAITPNADPLQLFGYLALQIGGVDAIAAVDLRPSSPTYGSILLPTAVNSAFAPNAVAINSDGSRVVMVGAPYAPPSSNTFVIDAAKMITDPAHAIIAQLQVNGGISAAATCTGFFSTVPPDTAPVVSGVSGDITNDAAHDVEITGGNFMQGALVRIGSMPALPANVTGGGTLMVTVPANAPAGNAIDIVVTNPETQAAQDQQNQSGLLAGQFNILLNPAFQPTTQIGTINSDSSFSVYNLSQRQMQNIPVTPNSDVALWPVFNADGKQSYLASFAQLFNDVERIAIPVDLSTNAPGDAIVLQGSHQLSSNNISASVDPHTAKPVVSAVTRITSDLVVSVIDTDSTSPTFNTIIRTFDSGSLGNGVFPFSIVSTADGKYAYVWYSLSNPFSYYLEIVDLSTGMFSRVSASSLRAAPANPLNGVNPVITPDGKSLLLSSFYGNRYHIEVIDISTPIAPKHLAELVPVPVPGRGFPVVTNYQVVGNTLYAFDPTGIIVVFNYRRDIGDFRQRGWSIYPITSSINSETSFAGNFGVSVDGAWLYVADPSNDMIAVLDASKVSVSASPLVTAIRAPYSPYRLAVSPVPPPSNAVLHQAPPVRRGAHSSATISQRTSAAQGPARIQQP